MEQPTGLTITVKVDTTEARREVERFRSYALGVIAEIRAAYAAAAGMAQPGGQDTGGRRV